MVLELGVKKMKINEFLIKKNIPIFIGVPLIILLLFNIAVGYVTNLESDKILERTKNYFYEIVNEYEINDEKVPYIDIIRTIKNLDKNNVDIITTKNMDNYFYKTGFLKKHIKEEILYKYKNNELDNDIINTSEGKYKYEAIVIDENFTILFITGIKYSSTLITSINISLSIISFCIIIFLLCINKYIVRKISKPISDVTDELNLIDGSKDFKIDKTSEIEEVNKLVQKINEMNEKIIYKTKNQNIYFQNISHELKTPLMSISGYALGIKENIFKDKEEALDIIIKETELMNRLVNNLIDLSKIDNNTFSSDYININEEVHIITEKFESTIIRANKSLEILAEKKDIYINLNKILFHMIMENLISNAVKFSCKKIEIEIKKIDKKIIIKVINDGEKIDKKDIEHVFERFYKGKNGSSGLGLSIVKSAVDKLNCKIKVESKKERTLFEVEF